VTATPAGRDHRNWSCNNYWAHCRAFFELPTSLFTEALPWGKAIDGLRSVLTFGQGVDDVLPTIMILTIETIILFIIGVIAFSRTQLKAE
jgi:hypothetical protein